MDNTQRFSNKVEDYVKYRPHYPAAMVTYLQVSGEDYCPRPICLHRATGVMMT
jgi:hypothetical protein